MSDIDSLLKSVTPPGFQLTYWPQTTGYGGSVGFLTRNDLRAKAVDAPTDWILHVLQYQRLTVFLMAGTINQHANTSFAMSLASTAADLYDHYISNLGGVLDRHVPFICQRAKKTAGWLSDSYRRTKSIRRQFEHMWHKDRSQLSRSRLPGAMQS